MMQAQLPMELLGQPTRGPNSNGQTSQNPAEKSGVFHAMMNRGNDRQRDEPAVSVAAKTAKPASETGDEPEKPKQTDVVEEPEIDSQEPVAGDPENEFDLVLQTAPQPNATVEGGKVLPVTIDADVTTTRIEPADVASPAIVKAPETAIETSAIPKTGNWVHSPAISAAIRQPRQAEVPLMPVPTPLPLATASPTPVALAPAMPVVDANESPAPLAKPSNWNASPAISMDLAVQPKAVGLPLETPTPTDLQREIGRVAAPQMPSEPSLQPEGSTIAVAIKPAIRQSPMETAVLAEISNQTAKFDLADRRFDPASQVNQTDRLQTAMPQIAGAAIVGGLQPLTVATQRTAFSTEPATIAVEESGEVLGLRSAHSPFGGTGRLDPLPITPQTAPMISGQLTQAVQNRTGNQVEVTLNPEELGRVRMGISTHDTTIVIGVSADRPETMDLIRRHIELLTKDMQQLGYTDVQINFGQGQHSSSEEQKQEHSSSQEGERSVLSAADAPQTPVALSTPPGGLDLRM